MAEKRSRLLMISLFSCVFIVGCAASAGTDSKQLPSDAGRSPQSAATPDEGGQTDQAVTTAETDSTTSAEEGDSMTSVQQTDSVISVEEAELPASEWQLDITFPDWKGDPSSTYAINNCVGFSGYSGQGGIYLTCDSDVTGFELFVNGRKTDVSAVLPGRSYLVDISSAAVTGINSLQLSGLESGTVRVCIPYPVIIGGEPEDVGLDPAAFALIDRLISADIENGFPSAQLAVVKDGRLVYENAWGHVRTCDENGQPAEAIPVTTDTLYDLASNTKMYSVNYAIQHLVTKGELDLDSRIVDILGREFSDDTIHIDYEGYEAVSLETNKAWKEHLTVRDLLRHQGGFPPGPHYYSDRYDHASQDFDSDKGNLIYVGTAGDMETREETWKALCRTPLMYEPGSRTIYSDVDYMVLCYCIEGLTGKTLDEYLAEVFFEPMGLHHITYNPLAHGFVQNDCAATELMGNTRDGRLRYSGIRTETIQGEVHDPNAYYCMAGISGHAGLFSNAGDLAKLAAVMLTGGYGDRAYFSQDVIDLFTAPKSGEYPNYGLGWWREADHRRDHYFGSITDSGAFGHQGFTGTLTVIDPEQNLVVVLLTNKLHSKMLDPDETLSKWSGNFYTTATLGFASQIIKMAAGGKKDESVWGALVSDMAADAKRQLDKEGITDENHPRMLAYKALLSVRDSYDAP